MKLPRRRFLQMAGAAAVLPGATSSAGAQNYPARPIRLVVPFPPGGAYDAIGRSWADKMKSLLGTVVVENMGGGGSSLGAAAVARAPPDGHTILLGGSIPHVPSPPQEPAALRSDQGPRADSSVAVTAFAIAVHPSLPAQTLKELVNHAKAYSGTLSYGSPGVGTLMHLTGELLKSLTGADITHVPYRGGGPAITDLIGGQIQMIVAAMTGQVLALHRSGKLRVLAVTSSARLIAAPELSTAAEMGFPSMIAPNFIGLFAPARTPNAIIEQIAQATRTALAEGTYRQALIEFRFEPDTDSSAIKFRRSLEEDIARWTPVVRTLGLKID